jgi:AcrR family transcriptional regulator
MRSKRDEDRTFTDRARRAQIVAAVIALVAERGYRQASVGNIAERVGIAKSVVLYHFANKDELVGAVVTEIFSAAAAVMLPAVDAEATAAGKLRAYIRSNGSFIATHRAQALALLDIWTSFRTSTGLRLDEAAAQTPPPDTLAALDPLAVLLLGQHTGEFRAFSAPAMAIAVRQAIDGAVLQLARDAAFNVPAYCEEVVELFDRATRRDP